MANIFTVSIKYTNMTIAAEDNEIFGKVSQALQAEPSFEIRVGYFGRCIRLPQTQWVCDTDELSSLTHLGGHRDPLKLFTIANDFQHGVLFSGIQ